jgi:hypothetical protein
MNRSNELPDAFVLLQRIHRWRMAFFSVIILLAGTVIGASGMFIWNRHRLVKSPIRLAARQQNPQRKSENPDPNTPAWVTMGRKLDQHLGLSDEQHRDLVRILRQHWQQLNKIKQEARPRIRENLLSMNEKVTALLDDRQKNLWRQDFRRLQLMFQLDYRSPSQPRRPSPTANKEGRPDRSASPAQRRPKTISGEKRPSNRPAEIPN